MTRTTRNWLWGIVAFLALSFGLHGLFGNAPGYVEPVDRSPANSQCRDAIDQIADGVGDKINIDREAEYDSCDRLAP